MDVVSPLNICYPENAATALFQNLLCLHPASSAGSPVGPESDLLQWNILHGGHGWLGQHTVVRSFLCLLDCCHFWCNYWVVSNLCPWSGTYLVVLANPFFLMSLCCVPTWAQALQSCLKFYVRYQQNWLPWLPCYFVGFKGCVCLMVSQLAYYCRTCMFFFSVFWVLVTLWRLHTYLVVFQLGDNNNTGDTDSPWGSYEISASNSKFISLFAGYFL